MKTLLKVLFVFSLGLIFLGYFFINFTEINGKLFIGLGVLNFAFILMPLFVYYRYKDRLGDFIDRRMEKPEDKESN
jgi:hypothetical protein